MKEIFKVGQIYTPREWAVWLLKRGNVFNAWCAGARICDPTAGDGSFALALFSLAREKGIEITPSLLERITLIDIDEANLKRFRETASREFHIRFPEKNLLVADVLFAALKRKFDILVGNPPWANYTDLPEEYQKQVAPLFLKEFPLSLRRNLLFGSSRADLAALILKKVLGRYLERGGAATFFVPLSLFFGDGAHEWFRNFESRGRSFCVKWVYEFTRTKVFNGINTSYGAIYVEVDQKQAFPVEYYLDTKGGWLRHWARPVGSTCGPWRVSIRPETPEDSYVISEHTPSWNLEFEKPRQGVNTCGANRVFIFEKKPTFLPEELLFPLATSRCWVEKFCRPEKWIFIPYNRETGKPLEEHEFESYPSAWRYLCQHMSLLRGRKGVYLQNEIKKGRWWALLGVGKYAFAKYKVIWEAYGAKHFNPIILEMFDGQPWQGNQAMHAYIPCWSYEQAKRAYEMVTDVRVETLLCEMNGIGKRNWAQPGKIIRILDTLYKSSDGHDLLTWAGLGFQLESRCVTK